MLDHILNSRDPKTSAMNDNEAFVEGELILYVMHSFLSDAVHALTNRSFAGADTIASTIRVAIYYLVRHPIILQKLRNEISLCTAAGLLSDPPKYHETAKMPYLLAVLRESLRIFPAASAKFMRTVPAGGAMILGVHLPEGTNVGSNSWVLHHNKEIFGEDANDFRPERWLEGPERVNRMSKYDFSFGMGARECAGKQVALVEIQKTVVQVCFQRNKCLWSSLIHHSCSESSISSFRICPRHGRHPTMESFFKRTCGSKSRSASNARSSMWSQKF